MNPELLNYYKARGAFDRRRGELAQDRLFGAPPMPEMRNVSPMEWLFRRYLMEPDPLVGMVRGADILAPQAAAMSDISELEYYLREPDLDQGTRAMLRGAEGLSVLGALPVLGVADDAARIAAVKQAKAAAKAAKEAARTAWLQKFPALGQKFGPRKGFYSKLERAIRDMSGATMPTEEFRKYLKSAGITDAELQSYDIDTLLQHSGKTVQREELADWTLRRRPDYTETRRMGTERSWDKAQREATRGDIAYDYDRFRTWRDETTDALVNDDIYDREPYVEPINNEDGDAVGYRLHDADGDVIDEFDSEDAAELARERAQENMEDNARGYYNEMTDNSFVRQYDRSGAYTVEEFLENNDWVTRKAPAEMPPRYARDPGPDADTDPFYAAAHGRWGTSHYSPGASKQTNDPNYFELIEQMPPIARTHRRALEEELGADANANVRDLPLFKSTLNWREQELGRIPARATEDWNYTTHWEEPNPVEHIRGYYDVPEMQEGIPPGLRGKPLVGNDLKLRDFLEAGYSSRVDVDESTPGRLDYLMTLTNPEGEVLHGPSRVWSAADRGAGLGGLWERGGMQDTALRNSAIEEYVNSQLEQRAREDLPRYHQAIGYDPTARFQPTGKRGLYASEMQADLEQQSRREYYPTRTPPPPTREELMAQGFDVQPVPLGRTSEELYDSLRGPDWGRLELLPEWREYLDALPAERRQRLERLREGLMAGEESIRAAPRRRVDPFTAAEEVRTAAEAAGVPTEFLPYDPPEQTLYQPGQWRPGNTTNIYPADDIAGYTGVDETLPLDLNLPMGDVMEGRRQFVPLSHTGGFNDPEAGWADLLERQARLSGPRTGNAPQFPLTDDRYQLAMKRALLEAAYTDQDFVAWNTPEVMSQMNIARGEKLFPQLYGEKGYLATGTAAKASGLKGKAKPVTLDMPDPYTHEPLMRGLKLDLDEATRQKIKDEGFSLWQFLPYMVAPAGAAGVLGYWGDPASGTD